MDPMYCRLLAPLETERQSASRQSLPSRCQYSPWAELYRVAQKMSHWTTCKSRQPTGIFSSKFQDLQRKEFSMIVENFTEIFSLLQEIQLLQYFIPYFTITPKNVTKHFFLKAHSNPTFHISSMSFCEPQYGLVD